MQFSVYGTDLDYARCWQAPRVQVGFVHYELAEHDISPEPYRIDLLARLAEFLRANLGHWSEASSDPVQSHGDDEAIVADGEEERVVLIASRGLVAQHARACVLPVQVETAHNTVRDRKRHRINVY